MLAALLALTPLQTGPIPAQEAARIFGELELAAQDDGGALWGHAQLGPVLLVEPGTRVAVANTPDAQGQLHEHEGVFAGTLPPELGIANTAVEWAGERWTMVRWPLPEEEHARLRLLLHECFHRIQPELGHGGGDPPCAHLDTTEGRIGLRLELRALARALRTDGIERRTALEDALAFRAERRTRFLGAAERENALERHEGLAEYTGLVLCGEPRARQLELAAQRMDEEERGTSFVRTFAYATGPAYGLLLDARGERWRPGVDAGTDLAARLAAALAWRPAEPPDAGGERARRHGGDALRREEERAAAVRERRQAERRARFVDAPVLRLALGQAASFTFDPGRVTPLPELGSVYAGVRVVDAWGLLQVDGEALVLQREDGVLSGVVVPAPPDASSAPLAGEGWTLELARGWRLVPGARAGDWSAVHEDAR